MVNGAPANAIEAAIAHWEISPGKLNFLEYC
jgi:hypothetical protein